MKSKILIFTLLSLAVATMLPACSSEPDLPNKDKGKVIGAYITYDFELSPEMLEYFDISYSYWHRDTIYVEGQMTREYLHINTQTANVPGERDLNFTVTRKAGKYLADTPEWQVKMDIMVNCFYGDGTLEEAQSSQVREFAPTPAAFDSWADKFITLMGYGYRVYIRNDGQVAFSTE